MKLSITALSLSLASTAVSIALPGGGGGEYHGGGCLSQGTADTIVAEYAAIQAQVSSNLGSAKQTARQLLASDFQETSDSLNELIGLPLGSVTFGNKADYINAVLTTDPAQLDTIKTLVSGCNYITWYWQASNVGQYPVKGFHLFEINSSGQISEVWLEFNSIAWNEDIGGTCTIPNSASSVAARVRL